MMQSRETVHAEELQSVVVDQEGTSLFSNRMFVGAVAGAGLGILSGMSAGFGFEGAAEFGMTLPVMLGLFTAGAGTIGGAFIDLLPSVDSKR
ncbi:MAG: hypothetical protein HC893_04760 [Chloroflexaceae bacterium]|nr:hypothetical protein [Chloroflexaceae bacterium]NJL33283.1 hypothetical protein [Chloroflexaceae bacterium]NJO04467.1 hypothetical protein [Chloroflexaceae bacterium]